MNLNPLCANFTFNHPINCNKQYGTEFANDAPFMLFMPATWQCSFHESIFEEFSQTKSLVNFYEIDNRPIAFANLVCFALLQWNNFSYKRVLISLHLYFIFYCVDNRNENATLERISTHYDAIFFELFKITIIKKCMVA